MGRSVFARSFVLNCILLLLSGSAGLSAQHTALRTGDIPQTIEAVPQIKGPIDESHLVTLQGNIPHQATAANDRGAAASSLPMNRIMLLLKRSPEREQALRARLDAMHDSKSSQYHQWLTPAQFGEQYGPAPEDIGKVSSWLSSHGFSVNGISNGRSIIEFSGDAAAVESTFHAVVHSYTVKGKTHYANANSPQIPDALAGVVAGVVSLNSFEKQSHAILLGKATLPKGETLSKDKLQLTPDGSRPNFSNSTKNAVGPGDLWTIYNETPLIKAASPTDGKGQTIAIVGRSDINSNDFLGFRQNFLPAPYAATAPLNQIHNGPDPGVIGGDDLESTLDVEYSTAMAPAATVDLVVSGSTNSTDGVDLSAQYIVDNNLAPVVSTSYGLCEALLGTAENAFYNALWQQAAAQGITSMVSSGDNGSAGCDLVGPSNDDATPYVADVGLQVSGIASTPYNVAVGGTQFTDDSSTYWGTNTSTPGPFTSAKSFIPEMVWNESCSPLVCGNAQSNISAGSGGVSSCLSGTFDSAGNLTCTGAYTRPSWQKNVYGLPSDDKRHLPDISLNAAGHDGYMVCYQNSCDYTSFYIVGGTSASSPAFAGVMSLVNQATGSRQGQANYTLYSLAATAYGSPSAPNTAKLSSCNASNGNTSGSSCIFHDVTVGTNAVPCDGGTPNCSATKPGTFGVLTDYAATAGYDSATGLGSINIANLVAAWNSTPQTATTTSVAFNATTSTFGSPLGINVKVAGVSGTGTPTGDVALLTDSTLASAVGGGVVTLTNGGFSGTVSSLPGGTYNIVGRYAGDNNFASSTSSPTKLTINRAASTSTVTMHASDPLTGNAVKQTVFPYGSVVVGDIAVTGVAGRLAPQGAVVLTSAGKTLASLNTAADGTTSYTATGLAIGSYSWTASFAGDNNYNASVSPATSFSIGQAGTVAHIVTNTSYVVGTGSATVTAIVEANSFLASPTGTVTLTINGNPASTATLAAYKDLSTGVSSGKATFTVAASQLSAGKNTVAFSYAGDGNYLASTSSGLSIGFSGTVPVSSITLTASSTALAAQAPVTLTAAVTTGGIDASVGTVNFYDGTALIGTAQVVGSTPIAKYKTGTASLKIQLAPGSHIITATYLGIAAAPAKVSSTAVTVGVTGTLPSSISLTSTPSLANAANYDLTATVLAHGFAAPTSTVDFSETSFVQSLGQAPVDATTTTQTLGEINLRGSGDSRASPALSVIGDFNGDGIADLATANASFSTGSISILLGKGDGTFGLPTLYKSPLFSDDIETADVNNDGALDLVVTANYGPNFTYGPVSIFLGNGDGTFQAPLSIAQTGFSGISTVADLNRDGVIDVATLSFSPMQVSVAFGNGDGTFQTPVVYPLAVKAFTPYRIIAVDVNNDGAPDLVEVNNSDNTTQILLNDGNGTFTFAKPLTTHAARDVAAGDLNGDGKVDLAITDYSNQAITVFTGNGDSSFATGQTYPLNGYPSKISLADMNHDGKLDLVAALFFPATNQVAVLTGNGDGTFGAAHYYSTGQGHGYGITVGDLNGDGTPDVVNCDINSGDSRTQNIAVLLNVNSGIAAVKNASVAGPRSTMEQIHATYNGDSVYSGSVSPAITVLGSGSKATPVILWQPAAVWGAGVPLGSAVLNATVQGQIAGTFTYTATLGSGTPVAITPASTLSLGTYTLTATFTPTDPVNYTPATATRTLTIATADFNLQSSVQTLTIAAGSSGMFTITVPPLYGFNGTIALSATGLPGGFTFTANPANVTAGGSSTITIGTSKLSASNPIPARPWNAPVTGGTILTCLAGLWLMRRRRMAGVALTTLLIAVAMTWMSGCGGVSFQTASVSLVSATPKAASGSAVQMTATVKSPNSLKGTVTFLNGNVTLGAPVAVANGTATLTTSSLPVGLNSLTAVYSGDSDNSGATSSVTQQLITGSTSVQITGTMGTISHSTAVTVTLN